MHFKIFIAGALASCALLSACTSDELPLPEEELYAREFVKEFGLTDPTHDYNMAQSSGIKVITSAPTDLKVYAKVDGRTYLFAEGRKVSGTTAIPFSVPKGVSDVMVKVGNTIKTTTLGQTLDLRGLGRAIEGSETEDTTIDGLTWRIAEETILPTTGVASHINKYPEGGNNLLNGDNSFYFIADGEEHTFYPFYWNTNAYHCLGIYTMGEDGYAVPHDLYYSKSGELEYSTDYIEAIEKDITYLSGDIHIFKQTESAQFKEGIQDSNGNNISYIDWYATLGFQWGGSDNEVSYNEETKTYLTKHGYISKITFSSNVFTFYETVTEPYTEHISQPGNDGLWNKANETPAYAPGTNTHIKTRGITYSLPKGTPYGFYIKVGHYGANLKDNPKYDYVCFSHSLRNSRYIAKETYVNSDGINTDVNDRIRNHPWPEEMWNPEDVGEGFTPNEANAFAYASWSSATMEGKTYTMFGFEDCARGYHPDVCDLNDIMFLFEAGEEPSNVKINDPDPIIPDDEVFEWIIAAEDLGGTYDWDFNDAVFSVKAKTIVAEGEETKTEITVEPLAAGGTMPVYIMFDGAIDGTDACYHIGSELHSWFGDNSLSPINVGTQADATAKPLTFTVAGEWSLNSHQNDGSWTSASRNMGGFWLLADPEGTVTGNSGTDPQVKTAGTFDGETHKVTAPQFGENYEAPQMFCLTGDWQWPKEEKNITDAYASFNDWMGDKAVKWYGEGTTFDESLIVKRNK